MKRWWEYCKWRLTFSRYRLTTIYSRQGWKPQLFQFNFWPITSLRALVPTRLCVYSQARWTKPVSRWTVPYIRYRSCDLFIKHGIFKKSRVKIKHFMDNSLPSTFFVLKILFFLKILLLFELNGDSSQERMANFQLRNSIWHRGTDLEALLNFPTPFRTAYLLLRCRRKEDLRVSREITRAFESSNFHLVQPVNWSRITLVARPMNRAPTTDAIFWYDTVLPNIWNRNRILEFLAKSDSDISD